MAYQTNSSGTMDPLAVSVPTATRVSDVGRTKLYEAMADGELLSCKIGKRRLILLEDLRAWLVRQRQSALRPRPTTPATKPLAGTERARRVLAGVGR